MQELNAVTIYPFLPFGSRAIFAVSTLRRADHRFESRSGIRFQIITFVYIYCKAFILVPFEVVNVMTDEK
jgi:hypothetical protein